MQNKGCIGIFDSGYGGLTIMKEIVAELPSYNYMYLGDNARAPYGTRSFETVYQYTLSCVQWFFNQGCPLVILACNTASAKALRTIQQNDLPKIDSEKRVLGVIRPTTEVIGQFTKTNNVGILGTNGTVISNSYPIEIEKFYPNVQVYQEACPMWVPLVENNEQESDGANYFVQQHIQRLLQQQPNIDTILLACTHYPLLLPKIQQFTPTGIQIVTQGTIVAKSLAAYLQKHTHIANNCLQEEKRLFYTTDSAKSFNEKASIFWGEDIASSQAIL
ncbi:MAG: glutamate racemase [Chitinophagaceae bacterium]